MRVLHLQWSKMNICASSVVSTTNVQWDLLVPRVPLNTIRKFTYVTAIVYLCVVAS